MTTMTFTGELTIVTCWCGINHAVPQSLRNYQLREHEDGRSYLVYCPLGHKYTPVGKSRAEKLQRELDEEKARLARSRASHDQTRAELRETERRRIAQKGVTTRLKNRVANGVCPVCKRTFKQLAAHMKCKHAEYAKSEE